MYILPFLFSPILLSSGFSGNASSLPWLSTLLPSNTQIYGLFFLVQWHHPLTSIGPSCNCDSILFPPLVVHLALFSYRIKAPILFSPQPIYMTPHSGSLSFIPHLKGSDMWTRFIFPFWPVLPLNFNCKWELLILGSFQKC